MLDTFREPLDLAVKVVAAVGKYLITHQELLSTAAKDDAAVQERGRLTTFLELRKQEIVSALDSNMNQRQREIFLILHRANVDAIKNGELLISHLLTSDINKLIREVQHPPGMVYCKSPSSTAFSQAIRDLPYRYPGFHNPPQDKSTRPIFFNAPDAADFVQS